MDKPIERIIQEFVPGKQVTLAHLIAHPADDLTKKIGVPGAEAVGIMTLTPGETAMIAGDIATKAANVATKRYASTLMAFILDSARQYSGSTPQPISDTSITAIPIRVCSTVRTEDTSPHHSD